MNKINEETIQKTIAAIKGRGINVIFVERGSEALENLKKLIPDKASVMNGSSTTLKEIGLVEYLKSNEHSWVNLHADALNAKDQAEAMKIMRLATTADYFMGGVNAIVETGELVAADASGSRVGAYPFAAKNLILVSGVNKIVPTLEDAMTRVRETVLPLESKRVREEMGSEGSMVGKWVIIEREMFPERTTLILVNEELGF